MHESPGVHRILEGENQSIPIIQGVPINMGFGCIKVEGFTEYLREKIRVYL